MTGLAFDAEAIVSAALDAIVTMDGDGIVLDWNPSAERLFGWTREEVLGRELATFIIPEAQRDAHRAGLARYLETGTGPVLDARLELTALDRDGVEFPVELTVVATGTREAPLFAGFVRDLSARVQLERELRYQKSLLEAQGEASVDGMLVVAADGRMVSYNQRFLEMWGIPPEVAETGSDEEALRYVTGAIADPDAFLARVAYLYEHNEEHSRDEIRLLDGRIFDRVSAPIASEGVPVGRAWFFRDVTEDRRQQQRQRFLAETGVELAKGLELEVTLARIATLAVPRLADWCIVYLVAESGQIRRAGISHRDARGSSVATVVQTSFDIDSDATVGVPQVIRTGVSQLHEHVDAQTLAADARRPEALAPVLAGLPLRSWICVPLTAHGRTFGAISLVTAESGREYGEDDLAFAEEVARRAALALDNARLYREQHSTAETLQRSLLPERLPALPRLQLAARYLPGSETANIGGDWYDAVRLPGGRLCLVMGDVAGRGLRAASVMGQLRNGLRAYLLDGHEAPEALLRVGRFLDGLSHAEMATALCLTIDPWSGETSAASAGHPPPLIIGPSGSTRFMDVRPSPPLGSGLSRAHEESVTTVEPGSVVLLYTDGLVERAGESLTAGLGRLASAAAEAVDAVGDDPDRVSDRIITSLVTHADRPDDVAILAVRLMRATEPVRLRLPAEPSSVREARHAVTQYLAWAGIDRPETYDVALACTEAVANAVEHGHPGGEGEVTLEAEVAAGVVTVRVTDQGSWSDTPPDADRGRGLAIIERVMDGLEIERRRTGTMLTMRRTISGRG